MAQLAREQVGLAGLPLGERPVQDCVGGAAIEARHEVDGQVVGRPERGTQVRRRGRRNAGRFGEGDLGRPLDHRMALLVEPPAPGAAGQLEVLPRREGGAPGPAVLGEALDHHRPGRHVDAERQRLGGEDDLQEPGGEALLHRLPEDGHQSGMVRGDARVRAPRATRRTRGRAGRRRRAARRGARRPGGWPSAPLRRSTGRRRAGPGARHRRRRRG